MIWPVSGSHFNTTEKDSRARQACRCWSSPCRSCIRVALGIREKPQCRMGQLSWLVELSNSSQDNLGQKQVEQRIWALGWTNWFGISNLPRGVPLHPQVNITVRTRGFRIGLCSRRSCQSWRVPNLQGVFIPYVCPPSCIWTDRVLDEAWLRILSHPWCPIPVAQNESRNF